MSGGSEFSHLIEVDEGARLLRIHRVFPDGRRHLFTETPLPPRTADPKGSQYAEFARLLGEKYSPGFACGEASARHLRSYLGLLLQIGRKSDRPALWLGWMHELADG